MKRPVGSWWAPALVVLLLVLLPVLAVLQTRWIDALSESETVRQANYVQTGVTRLAADFEAELIGLEEAHRIDPQGLLQADLQQLAQHHARWRESVDAPDLVADLLWVDGSTLDAPLRLEGGLWTATSWSEALVPWRVALARLLEASTGAGDVVSLPAGPAGLLVPVLAAHPDAGGVPGFLLILLDPASLERRFGALVARHLEQPFGPPVDVLITRAGNVVYRSRPGLTLADLAQADVTADLGGGEQLEVEAQGGLAHQVTLTRGGRDGVAVLEIADARTASEASASRVGFRRVMIASPWEIRVRHQAGSIAAAVASVRRRNLATSFGVLTILGASAVLLLVAAQRTRTLAHRQMEFVAGITHELRTPLTVIRSAAENLVDGVVSQPAQARRYGQIIHDEGRRLSDLVEQALTLAGAQGAGRSAVRQRLDLGEFLPRALARWRAGQADDAPAPELEIADETPPILAHPASLEQALVNLLSNAVKYGGWPLGVRVGATADQVDVTVWDRGPGIPQHEQRDLFEPFFRGHLARASQAPGSGLGLSVVRSAVDAVGGSISVVSDPGHGSAFTLHLPVARS